MATGTYSLYLIHKAVFHIVSEIGLKPFGLPAFPFALTGALLGGALLYVLVEHSFLLLRESLEGRSRTSLAVSAAPLAR